MPLITKFKYENFKLYLWDIQESEKELKRDIFSKSLNERLLKVKSEGFRKGILSVNQLIRAAKIDINDIYYSTNGAPNLKSGKNISISHSKNFSGIAISKHKIGIDIESFRKKILNISPKFLNQREKHAKKKIDLLTFIWTAKESIYKAFKIPGISFSKQIQIYNIDNNKRKAYGQLEYKNQLNTYEIYYLKLGQNYITIAHEKID
tara:strand:+ start:6760 stop:7377 length:618 start_codon:yes stop_codon:yes gene_type:complete